MRTRDRLVYKEIKKWLLENEESLAGLGRQIKVKYSTLIPVLKGKTENNPEVKSKVSELIGFNPWERYPEQEYIPPSHETHEG